MSTTGRPTTPPPRPAHSGNMPQSPMTPQQVRKMVWLNTSLVDSRCVSRLSSTTRCLYTFLGRGPSEGQGLAKPAASLARRCTTYQNTVRLHSRPETPLESYIHVSSTCDKPRCQKQPHAGGAARHRYPSCPEVSEICRI